jgi:hypothetical protein
VGGWGGGEFLIAVVLLIEVTCRNGCGWRRRLHEGTVWTVIIVDVLKVEVDWRYGRSCDVM